MPASCGGVSTSFPVCRHCHIWNLQTYPGQRAPASVFPGPCSHNRAGGKRRAKGQSLLLSHSRPGLTSSSSTVGPACHMKVAGEPAGRCSQSLQPNLAHVVEPGGAEGNVRDLDVTLTLWKHCGTVRPLTVYPKETRNAHSRDIHRRWNGHRVNITEQGESVGHDCTPQYIQIPQMYDERHQTQKSSLS